MRLIHFSDWHSDESVLPEADLYVCTGDMLPNSRAWSWAHKGAEEHFQRGWIASAVGRYGKIVSSKAPLLVVRGNHDYLDLAPLFAEWPGEVYEFTRPSVKMIGGIKFGGFRGVPPICDMWADEMSERELEHRCEQLGEVDVLVTHCPAYGYLDYGGAHFGSEAVRTYLDRGGAKRAHLFGHVHEDARVKQQGGILLSNAACTVNVIEL